MSRFEHVDASTFDELARSAVTDVAGEHGVDAMLVTFNLLRVANRIQQDLETSVHRPAGVTWAAFRVLFAIFVGGPVTPVQLARLSSVSAASMSSVLNTLERNDLVRRQPSTDDRRSVVVSLTEDGHAAVSELLVRNNAREVAWAAALTARERRTFTRLLHKLVVHHPAPLAVRGPRIINEPGEPPAAAPIARRTNGGAQT